MKMNSNNDMPLFHLLTSFDLLLFFIDKIIHDIQYSKSQTHHSSTILSRILLQIPKILSKQLILSPLIYIQQMVFHIFNTLLRGLTHPLGLPYEIWDIFCLIMEDCQWACGRIYHNIFGSNPALVVRAHHGKGGEKGDESLPELEEEMMDGVGNEEDLQQQDQQQQAQSSQSNQVEERSIRYDIDELPPAFLSDDGYPPGWLVYHPECGVVTLEKLLELDLKKY